MSALWWTDPRRHVDLFVESPLEFEAMWTNAVPKDLGGFTVRIASIPDLLVLKRRAGRPVDLDDISALELIQRHTAGDEELSTRPIVSANAPASNQASKVSRHRRPSRG